jgi:hypothetical protein
MQRSTLNACQLAFSADKILPGQCMLHMQWMWETLSVLIHSCPRQEVTKDKYASNIITKNQRKCDLDASIVWYSSAVLCPVTATNRVGNAGM